MGITIPVIVTAYLQGDAAQSTETTDKSAQHVLDWQSGCRVVFAWTIKHSAAPLFPGAEGGRIERFGMASRHAPHLHVAFTG